MSVVSLASLLIRVTKAEIYDYALGIAEAVGLPVTSWQAGDPTRSLYHLQSEILATLEEVVVGFIGAGFLDYASDTTLNGTTYSWIDILAKQQFNVDVPEASFATTSVELTNGGGGLYVIAAGDLTLKSTTSGKTYRNTSGGTLSPWPGGVAAFPTLTVSVIAEEAGSESSAAAGEIDDLVTTLLGVTCTNASAAVGTDKWQKSTIIEQCRDKLGSFSPNGPREAYAYVARNSELTGTTVVTRVRVYADSDTGDVTVYLASGSGGVLEPDRALVEQAILTWATPLCITPTVLSATQVLVPITYELWVYKSVNKTSAEIAEEVEAALEGMFAARPIGGDVIAPAAGKLYHSMIESTIRGLYPQAFRVNLTAPSGDTALTAGQVAAVGTVTAIINIVTDA